MTLMSSITFKNMPYIPITAPKLSITMPNNFFLIHSKKVLLFPPKMTIYHEFQIKNSEKTSSDSHLCLFFAHTCSLSCIVIASSPSHVGHVTMEIILTKWTVTRRVIKNISLYISWILTFYSFFFSFQFQVCIENECLSFMGNEYYLWNWIKREKTKYREFYFIFFVGLYKAKKKNNVMKTYWPIKKLRKKLETMTWRGFQGLTNLQNLILVLDTMKCGYWMGIGGNLMWRCLSYGMWQIFSYRFGMIGMFEEIIVGYGKILY